MKEIISRCGWCLVALSSRTYIFLGQSDKVLVGVNSCFFLCSGISMYYLFCMPVCHHAYTCICCILMGFIAFWTFEINLLTYLLISQEF